MSVENEWDSSEAGKTDKSKKTLERNPNVDLYLSTIDELRVVDSYHPGSFINRILRRMSVEDDFWMQGLACAQYNPMIHRLTIKINPLMIWDRILRHLVVDTVPHEKIHGIDRELVAAFKDGGWRPERFQTWLDFMTSDEVCRGQRHGSAKICTTLTSVVVHEVLHCLWNHLSKDRRADDHKLANIAQDFAINQTIDFTDFNQIFMTTENKSLLAAFFLGGAPLDDTVDNRLVDMYDNIRKYAKANNNDLPSKMVKDVSIEHFNTTLFLNQPYEYYYNLLVQAGEGALGNTLGNSKLKSGMGGSGGNPMPGMPDDFDGDMYDWFEHVLGQEMEGMSDEEKEQAIKEACGNNGQSNTGIAKFEGFNVTNSEMKKVIGNDIKRTTDEMLAAGEIDSPSDLANQRPFGLNAAFVKAIEGLYKTDTKPWDRLLKNQLMKCLGAKQFDYTMKRESRGCPGMFPGRARLKSFDLVIILDVSGSINKEDYNRFVNEVEDIAKQVDHPYVRYIQFHSRVSMDEMVPLKKVRKIGIPETGGTVLSAPLDMLEAENNKKLVVIFTDGWVEHDIKNNYRYPSIMFVSSSGNESICSDLRERGFRVIHQDGDNDWWN